MLLELIYEFTNDLTPFYFYLSLIISTLYLDCIRSELQQRSVENQFYIRKNHDIQFRLLPKYEIIPRIIQIRNWLSITTKRMEVPDDDSEAPSFYVYFYLNRQGGIKWKQNLYSLSLKNIAFS